MREERVYSPLNTGQMPAFVIRIQELESGVGHYDFPIDDTWLKAALEETELRAPAVVGGTVGVDARMSGDDALLETAIRTSVVAPCIRCLGDVPVEVDVHLTHLMSPESKRAPLPEELELTPEEAAREYFTGEEIVLDELVREQILLDVPMQPLCSEDCAGIPIPEHVRGPERLDDDGSAIDPRLAPLMKLKRQLAQSEE